MFADGSLPLWGCFVLCALWVARSFYIEYQAAAYRKKLISYAWKSALGFTGFNAGLFVVVSVYDYLSIMNSKLNNLMGTDKLKPVGGLRQMPMCASPKCPIHDDNHAHINIHPSISMSMDEEVKPMYASPKCPIHDDNHAHIHAHPPMSMDDLQKFLATNDDDQSDSGRMTDVPASIKKVDNWFIDLAADLYTKYDGNKYRDMIVAQCINLITKQVVEFKEAMVADNKPAEKVRKPVRFGIPTFDDQIDYLDTGKDLTEEQELKLMSDMYNVDENDIKKQIHEQKEAKRTPPPMYKSNEPFDTTDLVEPKQGATDADAEKLIEFDKKQLQERSYMLKATGGVKSNNVFEDATKDHEENRNQVILRNQFKKNILVHQSTLPIEGKKLFVNGEFLKAYDPKKPGSGRTDDVNNTENPANYTVKG